MLDRTILFQAKSFLCWDLFPELSIQLVPMQRAVGYFYPPRQDIASIVLFFDNDEQSVAEALCFLFHEAGHFLQWQSAPDKQIFLHELETDKGEKKVIFEREAWDLGKQLLDQFMNDHNEIKREIFETFEKLKAKSLETYL